jgi:CheY-like chemotaxis protein
MVVDDSPVMRKLVMAQLRKLGCDPVEINSSTALIEKLQSGETADCIVMDWHMPDLDGVVTAQKLNSMGIDVPIILITGDDPELARDKAGQLLKDIVSKPISTAKLNQCLISLFGGGTTPVQETNNQFAYIPDLSGLRILLVDDNEFNREIGTELVRLTNAVVVTANDGQQAVDATLKAGNKSNESFDLILMDIQMPVMDGYAAAEIIRARFPQLPIVAITADVTTKGRDRIVESGMNYILTKPIDDGKLYRIMGKLLRPQSPNPKEVVQTSQDKITPFVSQPVDDWLNLPGFDSQAALDRMSGNVAMYRKFVLMFRDRNAFSPAAFHEALKQTGMADARRMIHTLKGTAGSVGAAKLSDAAENLQWEIDAAIHSAQPVSPVSIQKLETEWELAMTSLSKL